jgi:hypothetical protein
LILALVVGSVAWVLLAFGLGRSGDAFAAADRGGVLQARDFVKPMLFLAVAALLLAVVGTLRLSPVGALVLGIAYTSSYTLLLVAPGRLIDLSAADLSVAGRHADLSSPIRTGTSLVVGVLLLMGSIRAGRRRSPRRAGEPVETAVGIEGLGLRPSSVHVEPEPTRHAEDAVSSSWDMRTSRSAAHRW